MEKFPQSSAPPLDSRKLSHKITEIAAGEAHTLVLTADGRVYSWGRGMFGRLGTGSEFDQLFPVRVEFGSAPVKIVAIAAGAYHSLALADDGSVWGWGYNVSGEDSERKTLMISSVKAGAMMSVAIDSLGGLWIWGNCPQPQKNKSTEAEFSLTCTFNPVPVWNFHGHTVVKVACGNEHVVALVTIGETYKGNDLVCYSWGGNSHGQLGLGDREGRLFPEIIEAFNSESPWTVYEVACGSYHTALLAQKSPSDILESVCWTFGLGDNGQLGQGTTQSYFSPEPVKELPRTAFLISVDCGLFHTSVVSSAGDVWSWGMERGLGLCPDARFIGTETGDAILPLLIPCNEHYGPKFPEPVQVVCGAAHTVLLADSGYKFWSWGRGRSGVLGTGQTTDSFAPTVAMWPPIDEDFKEEVLDDNDKNKKTEEKKPKDIVEMEKKLLDAMGEINLLQSKLSVMERYASILHSSIFGRPFQEQDIPASLQSGGAFDIAKEWENLLESSDRGKLARLEMFYRNMLGGVKDNLLKKRIKEIMHQILIKLFSFQHKLDD
nr:ultraviolet-B receptor UVR8 [Ipomoea batatas]